MLTFVFHNQFTHTFTFNYTIGSSSIDYKTDHKRYCPPFFLIRLDISLLLPIHKLMKVHWLLKLLITKYLYCDHLSRLHRRI